MDYSLLLAIHNIDKEPLGSNSQLEAYYESRINDQVNEQHQAATLNVNNANNAANALKSQSLGPHAYNSDKNVENLFKA